MSTRYAQLVLTLLVGLVVGDAHFDTAEADTGENAARGTQPTSDQGDLTPEQIAFFETKIRPVLAESCYECHSADSDELQGNLRLDFKDTLARGGDSGPAIVPGDPDESLLIQAIRFDGFEMPPDNKLPESVVADFEKWVAMGAPDPRVGGAAPIDAPDVVAGSDHWAFQPVQRLAAPGVIDAEWPLSDIDRFILARLESEGLTPVADADRYTWLRRVTFDLSGLPPTVQEMDEFVADQSPDAYEKVVDRLLDSKAFGERWARYWLDLVGYADQRAAEAPMYAHHAWRYRDWVIESFNRDTPFDHFIRQQIAGDMLPADTIEERRSNLIGTGFLVLGDMRISDYNKKQLHVDTLDSQVQKVSKAFLGLTVGCARCHDHKFDPVPRDDYYALAGIFDSTSTLYRATVGIWSEVNDIELPETPEQMARRIEAENEQAREIMRMEAELDQMQARMDELNDALKEDDERRKKEAEAKDGDRKPEYKSKLKAELRGETDADDDADETSEEIDDPIVKLRQERTELGGKIAKLTHENNHAQLFISKIPMAYGVRDMPNPADMRITIRGSATALGAAVPRGVLSVLPTPSTQIPEDESGRMQLADWLASPENPLTPRVAVNRIWQKLIGVGLHRNVDYFGLPEGAPSHPQLLDFLAEKFMEDGWSQKNIIREIVLSHTYRMSSDHDEKSYAADPTNKWVWRMNRSRMDAEAIRDGVLAVSGKLKPFDGGTTFPFDIPTNVVNIGKVKSVVNPPFFTLKTFHKDTEFYRTVYLPIIRGPLQPEMADLRNVFDFTSPAQTAGQRNVTTVPTQALYLMNSPQVKMYAEGIAERVQREATDQRDRVGYLWKILLNRPVTESEVQKAEDFLDQAGEHAWRELCHALIASGEFLMRI